MSEVEYLESILKKVFNFMLIEALLLLIFAYTQRKKIKNFSVAINYLMLFLVGIVLLYILEWLCIHYIFTKKFIFKAERKVILASLGIENMVFIDALHYFIKFIFLGLFFKNVFVSKGLKIFFNYIILALVIFELIMVFYFKSYQNYDSISSTVKNIFLLLGSGVLLFRFYNIDNSTLRLQKNPYFWISLGLFIPAITEFFLESIFSKLFDTSLVDFYKLYLFRNASQIIGYLMLLVGFSLSRYFKFLPEKY